VYTGSADGCVYIYHLDGRLARRLSPKDWSDVSATAEHSDYFSHHSELFGRGRVIRDVSWHPFERTIVATSWSGCLIEYTYVGDGLDDAAVGDEYVPVPKSESDVSTSAGEASYSEEDDEPVSRRLRPRLP
jgi:hypothetical protein